MSKTPLCDVIYYHRMLHFKRSGSYPKYLILSPKYADQLWTELYQFIMMKSDLVFENPVGELRRVMGMNCLVMSKECMSGEFNWGFAE